MLVGLITEHDPHRLVELGFESQHEAVLRALNSELTRRVPGEERWFNPQDIEAPPTHELVDRSPSDFRREDVARVLADL